MSDTPIIIPRENGPLLVKNLTRLVLPDGSEAEAKAVTALCRCGKSGNKPYCDGSHNDAGFDGSAPETGHESRDFSYEGGGVTVTYNKHLCSHAAECGKRLPQVFDTSAKPWIQPGKADAAAIADVIAACPSGALKMTTGSNAPEHIVPEGTEIAVERNGPYRVRNIPLEADTFVSSQSHAKYVLCRCGLSANKPFCDGTHRDAGWKDDG